MKKKNKIMEEEVSRLTPFFENVSPDKKALAEDLINQVGFMKSVLYDLRKEISANGTVDEYCNGANQNGLKISAAMQSYNSMIKNYVSVNKQLASLLPKDSRGADAVDPLAELLGDG